MSNFLVLTFLAGVLLCNSVYAKEEKLDRKPSAARGDEEVEIKSFGGNYPEVLRIIDKKNNIICFSVANSNNGTGVSCQPLSR